MSASTSKMRRAKQTRRGDFSIEGPWVILVRFPRQEAEVFSDKSEIQ